MNGMFKIKNELGEERQFYDSHRGEWIVVGSKKSVLSTSPPKGDGWKVSEEEKKENKPKKIEEQDSSEEI